MRILIICHTMTYYSGSPLYNYTLAMELKAQGHDVSIYSMWEDNEMKDNLVEQKIFTHHDSPSGHFNLVLVSQDNFKGILDEITFDKCINIIHSEYTSEDPIIDERVDEYIAIRPSIKEHLIADHFIPEEKIRVLYNGIDFERFSKNKRKVNKEDYVKVVIPCTIDMLRLDFLKYYAAKANEHYQVFIYGKDYGNTFTFNRYVYVFDEVPDIENYIADADIVAGILLGRVNLEARAMGIISYIHNPKDPEKYEIYYPDEKKFRDKHDIVNLAKNIIL